MINGKRLVAVIPARGGSKSVPKKNIHPLGGEPLIAWTIKTASSISEIDDLFVSTDCEEIAGVARDYGCKVRERPAALATDTAMPKDLVLHLREEFIKEGTPADYIVYLEPTAPFRLAEDIECCINRLADEGLDAVATFREAELNPHRAWRIENNQPTTFIEGAIPWLRRQDLPPAYQLNGAVYAFRIDGLIEFDPPGFLFGRMGAVVMPAERSFDIDDPHHFEIAENMIGQLRKDRI